MTMKQSPTMNKETGQGPMSTIGKVIQVIGGIAFAYVFIVKFFIPALNAPDRFSDWILTSEGIQSLLINFVPIIIVIAIGGYIQSASINKRIKQQDQIIGLLKVYGTISLAELASRMGMTVDAVEKELTAIRVGRDVVFTISNGFVIMAGSEKTEPAKNVEFREVERITREIATTQCKYCGSAIPVNSTKCPNCGANLS